MNDRTAKHPNKITGTMAGPIYTGTEDELKIQAEEDLEWALNYGILEKDPVTGETREGPNVRDLDTGLNLDLKQTQEQLHQQMTEQAKVQKVLQVKIPTDVVQLAEDTEPTAGRIPLLAEAYGYVMQVFLQDFKMPLME